MKCVVFFLIICTFTKIVSSVPDKVVCYYGTWARYRTGNGQCALSHLDTSLCTHLIYSFVGIATNGSVVTLDSWLDFSLDNLNQFNALKQNNSNLKTLLAIGGWNEGSTKYSTVAADASLRAVFVDSALEWVTKYGFDGFDLDWEYPSQRGGVAADKANFITLVKEMKLKFEAQGLLLTAAVAASSTSVDTSYDVSNLCQNLDFINVMAYDLHGSYDGVTGHNAPLFPSSIDTTDAAKLLNVNASIHGWISRGCPANKLVLGLPMYGRTFTLSSSSNVALGAACSAGGTAGPYTQEAGMLGYNEILEKIVAGGWTIVWDDEQKVPHAYNGDQWIGYDSPESITLKVQFAIDLNLSGVMLWSMETDDFGGVSGIKYPLLNAIKSALASTSTFSNSNSSSSSSSSSSNSSTSSSSSSDSSSVSNSTSSDNSTSSNSASNSSDSSSSSSSSSDSSSSSSSSIPSTCSGYEYYRNSSNCNIYYACTGAGATPTQMNCATGLYFDTTTNVCNWPSSVSGCT